MSPSWAKGFSAWLARDIFLSARKTKISSKIVIFLPLGFFFLFSTVFLEKYQFLTQSFLEEKSFAAIRVNKVTILGERNKKTNEKKKIISSARFQLENLSAKLGSARAAKFQLQLITSN